MTSPAEQRLAIARGLQLAGRVDSAAAAYEEVLALRPEYHVARREIGLLSIARGDDDRAIDELGTYVGSCPLDMRAHHALIAALARTRSLGAALAHYGLICVDPRPLPGTAVCGMLVARDEVDRLTFTLDYYRSLGVGAFVVIDNASTDGTVDLLQRRTDVQLWSTSASYRAGCAGYAWVDAVLSAVDRRGWWMFVDADELFTYTPGDDLFLPDLCALLDTENAGGLSAILVDCYPVGPVAAATRAAGVDPRSVCEWFDGKWYARREGTDPELVWGGVRHRVFPVDGGYLLTKVPLVRWHPDVMLEPGAHLARGVVTSPTRRAALLHFKFLAGFADRSRDELSRRDVIVDAHQAAYVERGAAEPSFALFDPEASVRYSGPQQLVECGIIR